MVKYLRHMLEPSSQTDENQKHRWSVEERQWTDVFLHYHSGSENGNGVKI